nr:MAG TPA: Peptidyl-tRNA hydrolase [Bacteriophage sp.]
MNCYIIFAQSVPNECAYLLAELCTRLGLGYYSDWANDAHTRQCCAVGPATKGDKDQVVKCLSLCSYVIMEATKIENK